MRAFNTKTKDDVSNRCDRFIDDLKTLDNIFQEGAFSPEFLNKENVALGQFSYSGVKLASLVSFQLDIEKEGAYFDTIPAFKARDIVIAAAPVLIHIDQLSAAADLYEERNESRMPVEREDLIDNEMHNHVITMERFREDFAKLISGAVQKNRLPAFLDEIKSVDFSGTQDAEFCNVLRNDIMLNAEQRMMYTPHVQMTYD
ncbi:MAG: hypothetical protein ACRBDI_03385 [Alphaproteobacteria bacterium]